MNRPKRYIGRDSVASGKPSFEEMRKFYCDKEWMLDRIDQFEWDVKMLRKQRHMRELIIYESGSDMMIFERLCVYEKNRSSESQ